MLSKVRLYRAEFYYGCPEGSVRLQQSETMVGFWGDVMNTFKCSYQDCWIVIYDAITDKRLAGPLAPGERIPDLAQ